MIRAIDRVECNLPSKQEDVESAFNRITMIDLEDRGAKRRRLNGLRALQDVLLILWLLRNAHSTYGILLHLLLRQKFSNSTLRAQSINQLFSRGDVISYLTYRV